MTTAQAVEGGAQSRVGKRPVTLPAGVELKIDGRQVSVKGPKGTVVREMPTDVSIQIKDKVVTVLPRDGSGRRGKQFQKTARGRCHHGFTAGENPAQ